MSITNLAIAKTTITTAPTAHESLLNTIAQLATLSRRCKLELVIACDTALATMPELIDEYALIAMLQEVHGIELGINATSLNQYRSCLKMIDINAIAPYADHIGISHIQAVSFANIPPAKRTQLLVEHGKAAVQGGYIEGNTRINATVATLRKIARALNEQLAGGAIVGDSEEVTSPVVYRWQVYLDASEALEWLGQRLELAGELDTLPVSAQYRVIVEAVGR